LGLSWGCKILTTRGREVVFNVWMLEETKPLKQREALAVRKRIYIYNKLEKYNETPTKIC
jgi:GT2 family glycosyltransferase